MRIGVISDTHDDAASLNAAIALFRRQNVSLIVHCGDWVRPDIFRCMHELPCRLITVWGNNETDYQGCIDAAAGKPVEFKGKIATIDCGRILAVYHGERSAILRKLISSGSYDAILTGHTHRPLIQTVEGTLLVNPGTAAGTHGIQQNLPKTVAIYDSYEHSAQIIDIDK